MRTLADILTSVTIIILALFFVSVGFMALNKIGWTYDGNVIAMIGLLWFITEAVRYSHYEEMKEELDRLKKEGVK